MVCIPIVAYIILFRNHVTSRDVGNVKEKSKVQKLFLMDLQFFILHNVTFIYS